MNDQYLPAEMLHHVSHYPAVATFSVRSQRAISEEFHLFWQIVKWTVPNLKGHQQPAIAFEPNDWTSEMLGRKRTVTYGARKQRQGRGPCDALARCWIISYSSGVNGCASNDGTAPLTPRPVCSLRIINVNECGRCTTGEEIAAVSSIIPHIINGGEKYRFHTA
ncbi:hypothetical protein CBL_10994 [Carabus blaptoides fortunei]